MSGVEGVRELTLGEVLTIADVDGTLLCPFTSLREALKFLTGDDLYTHQIPRALAACCPWVRCQLPFLSEIEFPGRDIGWSEEEWMGWGS